MCLNPMPYVIFRICRVTSSTVKSRQCNYGHGVGARSSPTQDISHGVGHLDSPRQDVNHGAGSLGSSRQDISPVQCQTRLPRAGYQQVASVVALLGEDQG